MSSVQRDPDQKRPSGKTVLLRRMIEEAALLGIPAIVLDINNDLSRLGKTWPSSPEGFTEGDTSKARAYQIKSEVVIWTPGAASGRPISLKLLPDFAAIGDKTTSCKASAVSLAQQARKYGLGMIFATQAPKGIDNTVVGNCTTHVYGRMGSNATIEAIRQIMSSRGGAADDLGRLSRGEFYFSTEGTTRPFKIKTPMCLSYHPANAPTADEVLTWARQGG
jgi:hypothetical protein